MSARTIVAVAAALAVTLLATSAAADPAPDAGPVTVEVTATEPEAIAPDSEPIKMKSPSLLLTQSGKQLALPPGRFVTEQRWSVLDAELRRLQEAEVRLTAENTSLMGESSGWGWGTVAAVLGGVALGVGGGYWLSERY